MNKKVWFICLVAVVIVMFLMWTSIGGFPIIIKQHNSIKGQDEITNKNMISPLENNNFNRGHWKVVLVMNIEDISHLPYGIPKRRVLCCNNQQLLNELKKYFTFNISGGDMSTVDNKLLVYCDDTLVFETGVVLEQNHTLQVGIQNERVGWAEAVYPEELKNIFVQFKPYRKFWLIY